MKPAIDRARSAKIVATVGPASNSEEQLQSLFLKGVDLFRLNFSHGASADHARVVDLIRRIERRQSHPIGIMVDLQGPKLRLGTFSNGGAVLSAGQEFTLDLDPAPGNDTRVCLPHREILAVATPGMELLIDDGKVKLQVVQRTAESARTRVMVGGLVSNRKGLNVPNAVLPISALTEKDRADLAFALGCEIDWVALSFVQRPEDILEARKLIGERAAILAKIEKPAALDKLEEIVDLADGIMVARGDLGVEMPPEEVPPVQRRIIVTARAAGKPVIVATQMLESMIKAPTPTRAEASDVATAIYEGADAVMLSAETAAGEYPMEAVEIMDRIVRRVHRDSLFLKALTAEQPILLETTSDAITAAAKQVANTIRASAIVTYTSAGSTTLRAARERPPVPILCITPSVTTARRMCLVWGVHPVVAKDVSSFADMVQKAVRIAQAQGIASEGEKVVITAGVPFGTPGATNILRIAVIPPHEP